MARLMHRHLRQGRMDFGMASVPANPDALRDQLPIERVFEPHWNRDQAEAMLAGWARAVERSA
jgi:glycerol kinase